MILFKKNGKIIAPKFGAALSPKTIEKMNVVLLLCFKTINYTLFSAQKTTLKNSLKFYYFS